MQNFEPKPKMIKNQKLWKSRHGHLFLTAPFRHMASDQKIELLHVNQLDHAATLDSRKSLFEENYLKT
jgi:hypothetical protein